MHQQHHVYRPDSTKMAKMIAMLMAGRMLGPDWSRYAVHHYSIENNAVQGNSRIQIQSEHATGPQPYQAYLDVTEPGGVITATSKIHLRVRVNNAIGERTVWALAVEAQMLTSQDLVERMFRTLRYTDKDAVFHVEGEQEFGVVHPDNRVKAR